MSNHGMRVDRSYSESISTHPSVPRDIALGELEAILRDLEERYGPLPDDPWNEPWWPWKPDGPGRPGTKSLDILVLTDRGDDGRVLSFLNEGRGRFEREDSLAAREGYRLDLGDIDGDGDIDGIYTNLRQNRVETVVNDGTGNFTAGQVVNLEAGPQAVNTGARGVYLGDMDGDGDLDAVVSFADAYVAVLRNDGNGTFAAFDSEVVDGRPRDLALADINRDGDLDVGVTLTDFPGFGTLRNLGTGNIEFSRAFTVAGRNNIDIDFADMNSDGRPDAIVQGWDPGEPGVVEVHLNRPGQGLADAVTIEIPASAGRPVHVEAGDLDGDGDNDLAVATNTTDVIIFENEIENGRPEFTRGQTINRGGNGPLELGDLDRDGDLDLAAGSRRDDEYGVATYENVGTGFFVRDRFLQTDARVQDLALAPLDEKVTPDVHPDPADVLFA